MIEERQIGCCGASVWTKVIGYIEVILSVLFIIELIEELVKAAELYDNGAPSLPKHDPAHVVGIVFHFLMLSCEVLTFIMAIFLLRGTYTRNVRNLRAWMAFTVIALTFSTFMTILDCFVDPAANVGSELVVMVWVLAFQGFCLWVVGIHMEEIEAMSRTRALASDVWDSVVV